MGKSKAGLRAF